MKRTIVTTMVLFLALSATATAQTKTSGPTIPDWQLDPAYGTIELEAGFWPDPNTTNVLAGGEVGLESLGYHGFVAEAPDLDLHYAAGGNSLYIYVTEQDDDTVLLVNDPSGNWHFNDDAIGWQPGIEFSSPESGLYSIWIGTYGTGMVNAEIAISEIPWDSSGKTLLSSA